MHNLTKFSLFLPSLPFLLQLRMYHYQSNLYRRTQYIYKTQKNLLLKGQQHLLTQQYVCIHVHAYMQMQVCLCVVATDDSSCLPLLLLTLSYETGSLTDTTRQAGWLVGSREPPVPTWHTVLTKLLSCWCWGPKISYSFWHGWHPTTGGVTGAQYLRVLREAQQTSGLIKLWVG